MVHHTILRDQGGTAMIAGLLSLGMCSRGWDSRVESEICGTNGRPSPDLKGRDQDVLVHIHSTQNWPKTLLSCLGLKQRPVVTMHDASLFTGGCVYPLECRKWLAGCHECQRGYSDSHEDWQRRQDAAALVKPVLVSPSAWLAEMAERAFPGLKVRVIANGIEQASALKDDQGHIPDFQGELVLFVAHGGVEAGYKSGGQWMRIWKLIKKTRPRARALFVGNKVQDRTADVFHLPYLPNHAVRSIMERASILIYPSIADNHPLVILEAMMSRLPVVSFGVGGIPEQIKSGSTGILIRPGDYQAMAESAAGLLMHPRQARAMAEQAYGVAMDRFTSPRMIDEYGDIYQDLAAKKEEK